MFKDGFKEGGDSYTFAPCNLNYICMFAISGITMFTPLKEHGADKGGLVVGIMGILDI